jgi:hypothetical protein
MTNSNEFIERRKWTRFKVREGAFVAIKSDHYVVGPIHDISKNGFGFRYIGKKGQIHGPLEVDIFFCGHGFYLQKVKAETISDFKIDKKVPSSYSAVRYCSAQFCELTNDQISNLENFIKNFANRRSGEDRRKLPHTQYSGPERRKGVDRRKIRLANNI